MRVNLLEDVTALAKVLQPPLEVVGFTATSGSGPFADGMVKLRDGGVVWWILRERSILDLLAAPAFDASQRYDAPLLHRLLGREPDFPRSERGSSDYMLELMRRSVADVLKELETLRQPIAAVFHPSAWQGTRVALDRLAQRRKAEMFGQPLPD